MKILLRQQDSRNYFAGQSVVLHWSADEGEAKPFQTFEEADAFCTQQDLTGVEVLFKYGMGEQIALPLRQADNKTGAEV